MDGPFQPQHSNRSSAAPLEHAHLPWDLFSAELLPYKVFKSKFPFFDHNLSHLPVTSIEITAQSPSITAFSLLMPLVPPLPHFLLYLPSYLLLVLIMNNFNIFPISTADSLCFPFPVAFTSTQAPAWNKLVIHFLCSCKRLPDII